MDEVAGDGVIFLQRALADLGQYADGADEVLIDSIVMIHG
jgi:hypothetical protein